MNYFSYGSSCRIPLDDETQRAAYWQSSAWVAKLPADHQQKLEMTAATQLAVIRDNET